jgi:hypothetical protein
LSLSGKLITTGSSLYNNSLPGSPVNGQELYFQADAGTGAVWHLRYDSSLRSGAGAWSVMGGPPLSSYWTGGSSTTSTSYVDLGGAPSITAPVSGYYLMTYSCGTTTSISTRDYIGLNVNGTIISETSAEPQGGTNNANHVWTYNQARAVVNSGNVVKEQFYTQSGTGYFGSCTLTMEPYYVF